MTGYIGDQSRRVVHATDELRRSCLDPGFDVRDVVEVHTPDMLEYLLRGERWHACPHCLPDLAE